MDKRTLERRLSKVFAGVKGVDKLLVINTDRQDPNFLYLTGFKSGLFESSLLIAERKGLKLLTYSLEYQTAVEQKFDGIDIVQIKGSKQTLKLLTNELKGKNVGIDADFVPYNSYERIRKGYKPKTLTDSSGAFAKARLVKDSGEIDSMRRACGVTKMAMSLIQKNFRVGITERELATAFDSLSGHLGSSGPSFKTIVCFGKNAALPHHMPDDTRLGYGDFVLIDAGATFDNYCSDITRTFIFGDDKGKIRDYERKSEMYSIVKQAQLRAIKAMKSGVLGSRIHGIAQKYIDNAANKKYKGTFIHALGHSVGLEVHDNSTLYPKSRLRLAPGMVTSVEPGIYIPGFGGVRIEDDVLITKEGTIVL